MRDLNLRVVTPKSDNSLVPLSPRVYIIHDDGSEEEVRLSYTFHTEV